MPLSQYTAETSPVCTEEDERCVFFSGDTVVKVVMLCGLHIFSCITTGS